MERQSVDTDVGSPIVTEEIAAIASPLGAHLMKRKRVIDKDKGPTNFQLSTLAKDGDVQACPVGASPEMTRMKRKKK